MAKKKCSHEETEDTLIVGRFKKLDNDILLRDGVLLVNCKECKKEISNLYVAGGVVFNAKNVRP